MKRDAAIKLASEVRDLQIVDCEGRNCGICDDIEFQGAPGEPLEVKGLLVGPGAYEGRILPFAFTLAKWIAGRHMVRVPWEKVDKVTSRIYLSDPAERLGLRELDRRLEKPQQGAECGMRLSDLRGKRVRRESGEVLGCVHEVHIQESRATALICGAAGFLQRLTATRGGHRVPWEQVTKVTAKEIILRDQRP